MDFTQEFILSRFEYNRITGSIINKNSKKPMKSRDRDGYVVCSAVIGGKQCYMKGARLVWVMHNGDIQKGFVVDHINRVRDDNRLENLRLATYQQNSVNSTKYDGFTSVFKGVQRDRYGRWVASITANSIQKIIGKYSTEQAAAHAYNLIAEELFGEFAVLNDVPKVCLEDFLSKTNREVLTKDRRGLPKNTVVLSCGDICVRVDGKTIGRFKSCDKVDAITFAEYYNTTGNILDIVTNISVYNHHGLPRGITHCSTGYRVSFFFDGKRYHVGTYSDLEQAKVKLKSRYTEVSCGN